MTLILSPMRTVGKKKLDNLKPMNWKVKRFVSFDVHIKDG